MFWQGQTLENFWEALLEKLLLKIMLPISEHTKPVENHLVHTIWYFRVIIFVVE